jgi:ribosomal protein S18 acetylase RimI-like enzyme
MWRLRSWPNDPTVAHLVFIDHLSLPSPASVAAAVERATRTGARAIRTSALFPRVADVLESVGFEPIDRLVLLRRQLDRSIIDRSTDLDHRPRPLRTWHLRRAAHVDLDAFGPMWGNDTASLRDIRRATPHNRARLVRSGRDIAGFAISGAALDNGYLQRLSVSSTHRRQRIGHDLVLDALQWMYERDLNAAFVNTGVDNQAALELYDQLGFEALDDELVIAERRLGE